MADKEITPSSAADNMAAVQSRTSSPTRIGVLLGNLGELNTTALEYLIVHINTLQKSFQFEVLPTDPRGNSLITR
jgi:hypothetical protein